MSRMGLWFSLVTIALAGCNCDPSGVSHLRPELDVSASVLDFGVVTVGTSVERELELTNRGTATVSVSSFVVSGADAARFSVVSAAPEELGVATSAVVRVRFVPTAPGPHSARLTVSSDAVNAPELVVSLLGSAVDGTSDAGVDAGVNVDAGLDAGPDAGMDGGNDAGVADAGADAGMRDAGAGADAGIDAGVRDAGVDAGFDAGVDAGVRDAGVDAGFDAGVDAGVRDAGADAGFDAGVDAGACAVVTPNGWPTSFSAWSNNPVLIAARNDASQGLDNVFSPALLRVQGQRVMWHTAQGTDGHGRIFLAWSRDGVEWRRWPSDAAPAPVLDRGTSNHVSDPSVVLVGSTWRMYFTDVPTSGNERIWLAEATSLKAFTKRQQVLAPGAAGSWDSLKVGRPSVLLESGVYKLWYDGTDASGQRQVGLATSTDGLTFTRHPANPLLANASAVDVKNLGGVYVMVYEGSAGTSWATSPDGICWVPRGLLVAKSGAPWDAFGQVSPFLEVNGSAVEALWFGGATSAGWEHNRIGVAFPSSVALPAGGGCTACVSPGLSCPSECATRSIASSGTCGFPGSTTPSMCCSCASEGCDACKGTAADCNAACVTAGRVGGWCGAPGSTNPAVCCACLPP